MGTFINGYLVSKGYSPDTGYLVSVSYIKPGGAISRPEWEKSAFVRGAGAQKAVSLFLDTLVSAIAQADIPRGGYAVLNIDRVGLL